MPLLRASSLAYTYFVRTSHTIYAYTFFFLHSSLFQFFSFVIRQNLLGKNDEKRSRVDSRSRSNDKFVHASPFLLCSLCIPNNVDMLTHCLLQWDAFKIVLSFSHVSCSLSSGARTDIPRGVIRRFLLSIESLSLFVLSGRHVSRIYSTIDIFIRIQNNFS